MENEYYKTVGDTLRDIRKFVKLTQTEFSIKIGRSRDWYTLKELNNSRIYMKDYLKILRVYNFDVILFSENNGVSLSLREFEEYAIIRFMRESTGLSQTDFANSIGKKRTWQSGNEAGTTHYYANDLFRLANNNGFLIKLKKLH